MCSCMHESRSWSAGGGGYANVHASPSSPSICAIATSLSLPAPECPKGDMKTEKKKEKSN